MNASITKFDDVITELGVLQDQLVQNKLGNLARFVVFNTAYKIVTTAIKQAADDGYFENPAFVEGFTVCFARYYFGAIGDIVTESPQLPPAWAAMNKAAQRDSFPSSLLLLMGANAHINHDLPLALVEFMSQETANYSLHDIRKVDRLLIKSGKKIIGTFDESTTTLSNMKRRLRPLYFYPVMYTILYWRVMAWRDYRSMKKRGSRTAKFGVRSIKIADRLVRLGNYLSRV